MYACLCGKTFQFKYQYRKHKEECELHQFGLLKEGQEFIEMSEINTAEIAKQMIREDAVYYYNFWW